MPIYDAGTRRLQQQHREHEIDGTLSNWWTKIVTGILLFAFIALQQAMIAWRVARRSARQE